MTAPSVTVAKSLETANLGTWAGSTGWSIAAAAEPASPDKAITVYDTGGRSPLCLTGNDPQPNIQVRVRANSYPSAYAKMQAIMDELKKQQIIRIGGILSLGRDDNDRWLLTTNYQLIGD